MISKLDANDHYEIVNLIAEGGMGAVYKAKKVGAAGFEKTVAIKMMLDKLAGDRRNVDDFVGEAKLVANLIHENIVQIYDLAQCPEGFYFVLEFVDGISLYDFIDFHLKIRRQLPLNLAVFIAARVARGLAYAHSRRDAAGRPLGIVHCDVCPHNVLINTEGVPKITDFGIARITTQAFAGRVSGKLAFMAPEQARREEVDFRSDIYSLGIVLFFMISGKMARDLSPSLTEILHNVRQNKLDWTQLPADLPGELVGMLKKMLADDPADRYSDTSLLAKDLEYFIYKDGYGPTIVTLANYMRELLPGRFGSAAPEETAPIDDLDRTMVLDRTIVLNDRELNQG